MPPATSTVFIVDDDASVLRSLARVVRQAGYEARTFPSAEEFLGAPPLPPQPACLVVDLTMPGIGAFSALLILSEIGDISRFPDAEHLSSYGGLVPCTWSSGGKTHRGPITKQGSKCKE